jgi:hypothetical protein
MARGALFRSAPDVVAARRRRDLLRSSPRARGEGLASRPSFLGSAASRRMACAGELRSARN